MYIGDPLFPNPKSFFDKLDLASFPSTSPPHPIHTHPQAPDTAYSSGQAAAAASLARISASVIVIAAPGLLAPQGGNAMARAAVAEAVQHGCPLIILAPSSMAPGASGLSSLLGATSSNAAAASPSKAAPPADDGVPPFSEQALAWISAAWESRCPLSSTSSSAAAGGPDGPTPLATLLGLPDDALRSLPLETLRRLSVERTGAVPDLRYLNSPRLTSLKVQLAPPRPSTAAVSGGAPTAGASSGSMTLEHLVAVIRGNTTLVTLSLPGCSTEQSQAVAEACASSPTSAISSITVGVEIPLGVLLGRGPAPLSAIDLSQVRSRPIPYRQGYSSHTYLNSATFF